MVRSWRFPLLLKPHPQRGQITLLICRIVLEKLQELGKQFHWKKPESCPECGSIAAVGAWLRSSAVCRVCPGTVDEAVSLPGLPCGSYLQAGAIPAGDAISRSNSEIQPGSKAGRKAVSSSCAPADPAALVEGISHSLPGGRQLE
jgi:hypothetical protein